MLPSLHSHPYLVQNFPGKLYKICLGHLLLPLWSEKISQLWLHCDQAGRVTEKPAIWITYLEQHKNFLKGRGMVFSEGRNDSRP